MSGVGFLGELEVIDFLKKEKKQEIYIPIKDTGIDFISVGKKGFYEIQVKTSTFQKNSYFWFDLHDKKMRYAKNTYYVFVCKSLGRRTFMNKKHNFIVVPSLKIKGWISSGMLARKETDKGIFNIFIYPDFEKKTFVYKNKGKILELTQYWNNFKELE